MRILLLNQFFPPDPAPTGVLLQELAAELEAAGHTVDFVAARQDYRSGQQSGGRMRRDMVALARMLRDAVMRPRADVVISASSPPCLLVVATLAAWRHRAKSVHWIMDLYPEIAVALGEIQPGLLSRTIAAVMGFCYRRAARVVVLDKDMAECVRRHGVKPAVIRPWVFASVQRQIARAKAEPAPEWTWIYSGNLGRAHEWETLLVTQAILEKADAGMRLLFQGGGPSWPAVKARAAELGLQRVEWRGYVPEEELPGALLRGEALVVTQLPCVQGMLWPSKLGLVTSLPRPIAWVGPRDGSIAQWLRQLPHAGIFAPGEADALAAWMLGLREKASRVSTTLDPAAHRAEALAAWRKLIAKVAPAASRK